MRRITAVAGAITVLAPLLLAGASSASATARGTLTVTTLDRSGKQRSAQVAVYDAATDYFQFIDSGKATSLPDGTYQLITSFVDNPPGEAATVGGRTVKVSGATKTTFDARQGRPVNVSLSPNPGSGYDHLVTAYVCTADNGPAKMGNSVDAGHLYVIPSSDKAFELAYGTTYEPTAASGGDFYLATATHTGGVPSGMSATLKRSGLTALKVSARSGPDTGNARISFDYQAWESSDDCAMEANSLDVGRELPTHFTAHLPPGQWQAGVQGHDLNYGGFHTYAAGRTTSLTFGHAVSGPGGRLPNTWYHQLYVGDINPFSDPTLTGGGVLAHGTVKVTHAGRTVYSRAFTHSDDIDGQPVIHDKGWYTYSEVARRDVPSGTLSTTSTLTLRFYADPDTDDQVRDYITRFWPDALNTRNQAAPGSTTTVVLGTQRNGTGDGTIHQLSDGVKTVKAWYSTDGGSTWHAATARHSGGTWTIAVHNPPTGRVALRSTVTDTHGDTSTTTVYNAYAVS